MAGNGYDDESCNLDESPMDPAVHLNSSDSSDSKWAECCKPYSLNGNDFSLQSLNWAHLTTRKIVKVLP